MTVNHNNSDWDAIILARAGIERLKMAEHISSYIDTDEIVQSIHDENTFLAVSAERSFLRILEGGCQVPVGALAEIKSNGLYLSGIVGSVDGKIQYKKK